MAKVALFDLDKTIYNTHTFFPLMRVLVEEDIVAPEVEAEILEELAKHRRGESTYQDAANKMLVCLAEGLKGKQESEVSRVIRKFFENNKANFYPYFEEILPKLKQTYEVYLITTNVQFVASAIQEIFSLDGVICTNFEVKDGRFTGEILNTLADGKHVVAELLQKYDGDSVAVGDSENDIGMLELVDHAFCINPSPELLPVAAERGWKIVTDKNAGEEILNRV